MAHDFSTKSSVLHLSRGVYVPEIDVYKRQLYDLGYTRTTMVLNKEKQDREVEQNSETTSQ